jgi:hypothetical protein
VLIKKSLGLAQSFFRKDHGLRLVDRVLDEASLVLVQIAELVEQVGFDRIPH